MTMYRMLLLIFLSLAVVDAQAGTFDHGTWNELLQAHVRIKDEGSTSQVDYAGFAAERNKFTGYLQQMATVKVGEFDSWTLNDQLAFLLNGYNGWTVELILSKYPDLESIKDLGNFIQSPWKKKFIPLLGETRSLDDIEHGLIRGSGRYKDPRIHFAANCASIGCPALRAEAYRGADLERQLSEATTLFLRDRSRNRLNGKVLEVSSIFKWYREDFSQGWHSFSSLADFFAGNASALDLTTEDVRALVSGEMKIEFLDYDWRLNSIR
ncbi:MAG: DUF547 domain-containing protein [Pseudomonadota bacterium]